MMEHAVSTEWGPLMALMQMLCAATLLLVCQSGKCPAARTVLRHTEEYFYSFSPVALLCYALYKVAALC